VGGIYEVGAMAALAEALEGVDFTELRHLRRGQFRVLSFRLRSPTGWGRRQLARMLVENDTNEVFDPEMLLRPAFRRIPAARAAVPVLFWSSLRSICRIPGICVWWRRFRA
jgi:NTE family protein